MVDNPTAEDQAFQQIDKDELKKEVKAEAIKEAQEELVSRLQGGKYKYSWEEKGQKAPSDYDELFGEVDKRTVKPEDIDQRVEAKLKERDDAEVQKQEESRKQTDELNKAWFKAADNQWYDLQNQNKIARVDPDLQKKIQNNEKLTQEELDGDEGLQTRKKLLNAARQTGKSVKEVFYEGDYDQQPAGAKAPVLGGRPSAPQKESQEYSYEDVKENRKKIFGF